ncbi:MAG TPA: ABC transporter substrate-binding protein [Egibacteraceae bacterium]|nr:ABC transporter substrate-binding protein [Egibacteraceae bacterium]
MPQTSFATGKDLYWRHIGKVHGRTVEVFLVNDEYNPSRATSVCNDLIQREKVYVLIGGAGTDQISACARTAATQGVPYLSAGVDETQVRSLKNYFALSMTYIQQAPMLIQWVKKHSPPPNGKFGILRDRTPGFNAVVAW